MPVDENSMINTDASFEFRLGRDSLSGGLCVDGDAHGSLSADKAMICFTP